VFTPAFSQQLCITVLYMIIVANDIFRDINDPGKQ